MSEETTKSKFSGYLTKRGRIVKNWKRRWFVLEDGKMTYFTDENKKEKGSFPVKGMTCGPTECEGKENLFRVETSNRLWLLFADDYDQFKDWKDHLIQQGAQWDNKLVRKTIETQERDIKSKYYVGEEIGRGAFSIVKKATNKKTGEKCAVKFVDKKYIDKEDLELLSREIEIMKRIQHPNVLKLKQVFETSDNIALAMELVTGGELFYRIIEKGNYSEQEAASIVKQIMTGVEYLHEQEIAHRDLKPENLLCAEDPNYKPFRVVIADFGLSKSFENENALETSCGTPDYVAPEVITAEGAYSKQVDMWSIGVITYVLLCGYSPFQSSSQSALFTKILRAEFTFPDAEWKNISENAKDFIRGLLKKNPDERMTAKQALEHPWLNGKTGTNYLEEISQKMGKYNEERFKVLGKTNPPANLED